MGKKEKKCMGGNKGEEGRVIGVEIKSVLSYHFYLYWKL